MDKEATLGAVLTGSLVLGIIGLGLVHWGLAIRKLVRREPLVAWEPRRSAPWGLIDLIAAIVLWIGGQLVAAKIMQAMGLLPTSLGGDDLSARHTALLMLGSGIAQLVVIPLWLAVISLRTGATARDLGFVPEKLLSDIRLGAVAFTMLLPLVFVIQAILTRYQKYEHELINVLQDLPGWEWALGMTFVAGMSAPIVEEILFRLLLQGWLEKLFGFPGPTHELVLGGMRGRYVAPTESVADLPIEGQPEPAAVTLLPGAESADANPYASPSGIASTEVPLIAPVIDQHTPTVPLELRRFGWIAIGISALIFALLHWSHGPAWVALTVLAAGMGYLYQRTHRLVPTLVVHALLNNLTMLIVLLNPDANA